MDGEPGFFLSGCFQATPPCSRAGGFSVGFGAALVGGGFGFGAWAVAGFTDGGNLVCLSLAVPLEATITVEVEVEVVGSAVILAVEVEVIVAAVVVAVKVEVEVVVVFNVVVVDREVGRGVGRGDGCGPSDATVRMSTCPLPASAGSEGAVRVEARAAYVYRS